MSKSHLRNTFFALLFCIIGSQSAFATHIIGGEMNYRCLGNNQYEISLTVYRDCFLGEAFLDDTAYVAIYDLTGKLVDTLPMQLGAIDTIYQIEECLIIPPNICVETTVYVDTVELLPQTGGYHIAYQRCCRNGTILNILDPLNTGATYDIIITEEAMNSCNSSPVLSEWPPTFVCVNRPLVFDHSATDFDGDSLAYKLCTPYEGGISIVNPRPIPAFAPPYDTVVWNAPTYDLTNLLGGVPLTIDVNTGELNATPNIIGQFVIGVCVEEYRSGSLLSVTRRDFQYNVIPCEDVKAKFDLSTAQCENLEVAPLNQTGGTPDGYLWKFFDENENLIYTDTAENPRFTYQEMGTYMVRLIVNPNSVCIDSIDKTIFLQDNSIIPDFNYEIINCTDSLVVQFFDESKDSLGTINDWSWSIICSEGNQYSKEQNPEFTLLKSQTINVILAVQSDNGCLAEKSSDLEVRVIPDSFSISTYDTLIVCQGDSVELNPIFNPELMYAWSPSDGLNDVNAPNPKAFPFVSTAYVLSIRDSSGDCEIRRNVFLEVIDFDTTFDFSMDILECGDSLTFQITPDAALDLNQKSLTWEIIHQNESYFSTATSPQFQIGDASEVVVIGTLTDEYGCSISKERRLQVDLVAQEIQSDFVLCKGDSVQLNPDFNPNYTYSWSPIALFEDPSLPNPTIIGQSSQTIEVTINNQAGTCPIQKTVNLTVLNKANFVDFEFKVNSCIDSFVLEIAEVITEPIGNIDGILWELEGEIESMTSTEFKPTFVLKNSQFIDLKVSINTNTDCPSSFSKSFRISILEDIQLMDSLLICQGETVKLNSNPTTQNLDYEWSPTTDLNDAFIANPLANPSVTTRYQLTYSDTNKLCQMDRFVTVVVRDTMPKLEASYVVDCDARKVIFTPNSDALINWDFGDGSPIMQSSEGNSFQHIYETAGTYSVRLTFAAAHICPDQAIINIELPQNNIRPNFEWNVESCENNQASLELIDLTKAVYGKVTQWEWQLSNGEMANEEESVFLIDQSIPLTATLRITVDNNENCSDSITMEIPALLIEESILDSLIACKGDRVELNPDYNPSYTYEWTPSAHLSNPIEPNPTIELQAAQTFIVSMENEFECTLQDTIFTDVAPDIEVDILEVPTICSDMEIVLLAESEQAIKQWWLNEEGDTLGFEPELLINIDKERQLSVGFIDAFNCQKKELLNVDYQAIKLEYDQRQLACSTGDYQINLENLNPSIPLSFEWQPVAAIIDGANTANPLVRPSQDSQFIFVAKNDFGCEWIDTITVIQKAAPDLEVSATKDTIFDSETTQLMATQNPTYLYDWMPATSLNSATVYNPVASPKTSTVYTLTVTDDMGCTNTASIPITVRRGVCDFPYIFVPSGFTPNGDGENDVLYVRGTFITSLTFIIYDRWGDKVFESKNQDIGWDGKRNGKALSAGVYGYYLEAICLDGQRYLKQGNVTLIR